MAASRFPLVVAYKTWNLLEERKAILYRDKKTFYVWTLAGRVLVIFDPAMVEIRKINQDFAHALSTRLNGRLVVRTNSRGLFLQVDPGVPTALQALEVVPLDLSHQPTPVSVPVGMTGDGPLWISLIDADSVLIGGSRNGGKSGIIHAWIQALLHGGQAIVYGWDKKNGAEFGRYIGHEHFHFGVNAMKLLDDVLAVLAEREKKLTQSGQPNIVEYNKAHADDPILPIAFFTDEAADLPDDAKEKLNGIIRLYRHTGFHPVVATNQPTVAEMFGKTNLSTRICFRVPHYNDSITMLGYKGAETLPGVRGRGLIVWGGKFQEFQTFQIVYPMPSDAALRQVMEEQLQATKEAVPYLLEAGPDVESARVVEMIQAGKSDSAIVREVWGVTGGGSYYKMVERVKALRNTSSSTSSMLPRAVLGLEGAV